MPPRKKANGDGGASGGAAPSLENGFYQIESVPDSEYGDFDWFPKDETAEPPAGQYRLSEDARAVYSWCVDHVDEDDAYRKFVERLRQIVFGGLVSEPVARDARKRLDEFKVDLVGWANQHMRPLFLRAVKLRFVCMVLVLLIAFACSNITIQALSTLGNWLLLIGAASGSSAVIVWNRMHIDELAAYPAKMFKAKYQGIEFMVSMVLILGVTLIVQNKWITLQLGGSSIDITNNALEALGIGFVFGLLSDKLMQLVSPFLDRVSKSLTNTSARGRTSS